MMRRSKLATAIILITIGASGCTHTVYQTVPLPIVERPLLPAIPAHELTCLSNDTYQVLYQRENAILDYAEELDAIIRSTHVEYE